jgi:hypothetical protein
MIESWPDGAAAGTGNEYRDLRLDASRGLALWFIFVDHVPDNSLAWLTLRNYGFSASSEVFVFVSGYTCMLAYGGAVTAMIRCGENSLSTDRTFAIQLLISVAGIAIMIVAATLLTWELQPDRRGPRLF